MKQRSASFWEVLSLAAALIIGVIAGWLPQPIAYWRAPWVIVALGWFAAAALVRLARWLPAIPANIRNKELVQTVITASRRSMRHTTSLLVVVLVTMLYFTTVLQFYAPLEQPRPQDGPMIEAWFSRVAGFLIVYLLARTAILVCCDWQLVDVQANILLASIEDQAGAQTGQGTNGERQ